MRYYNQRAVHYIMTLPESVLPQANTSLSLVTAMICIGPQDTLITSYPSNASTILACVPEYKNIVVRYEYIIMMN